MPVAVCGKVTVESPVIPQNQPARDKRSRFVPLDWFFGWLFSKIADWLLERYREKLATYPPMIVDFFRSAVRTVDFILTPETTWVVICPECKNETDIRDFAGELRSFECRMCHKLVRAILDERRVGWPYRPLVIAGIVFRMLTLPQRILPDRISKGHPSASQRHN